jgi:hypothetical protein
VCSYGGSLDGAPPMDGLDHMLAVLVHGLKVESATTVLPVGQCRCHVSAY